ncbi:MAG: hypothetical protein AAFR73_12830 [Pseudomonadota bacterium]
MGIQSPLALDAGILQEIVLAAIPQVVRDLTDKLAALRQLPPAKLERYRGYDWDRLSPEEEAVFQIPLLDFPALVAVYTLYETVQGLHDAPLIGCDIEALQAAFPWVRHRHISDDEFQRFCGAFGISNRLAEAAYWRHQFWNTRAGHNRYRDEEGGHS